MRSISLTKLGLTGLFALLVLLGAKPCAAQSYRYQWATKLMEEYRFDEMAESIFKRMSEDSDKTEQLYGRKGLAALKRKQALRAEDFKLRDALNEESLSMYRKVAEGLPRGTTGYFKVLFEFADTLQSVVAEDIDLIETGKVSSDLYAETVKRDENRLNEAEQIYVRAQGSFDPNSEDQDIQDLIKEGILSQQRVRLLRAELIGTDKKNLRSPTRVTILVEARDGLEDFGILNEGSGWGYWSYLWMGRVMAALFESEEKGVSPSDVLVSYDSVFRDLVEQAESPDPYWVYMGSLAENWGFQFLNRHGLGDEVIKRGEQMRKVFKEKDLSYEVNGQLALIELARAYQNSGRSAEALEVAAFVSDKGGFAGQEADKLMSLIIRTAANKEQFSPEILASGANGAYVAAAKNPEKYGEAIELYQNVVANLSQIADASQRDLMGRNALYRIGRAYDSIGFDFESYVALEQCYRRFNTDNVGDDQNINQKVADYWIAVSKDIVASTGGSAFARDLATRTSDAIIKNPPKGSVSSPTKLMWDKAEGLRAQKQYAEALKVYRDIAAQESEYRERAMVKVGVVNVLVQREKDKAKESLTAADWVAAAKEFEDYIKFAAGNPPKDDAAAEARKTAMVEAYFQISECYNEAAQLEEDLEVKKGYIPKIKAAAEEVLSRSSDVNVEQHARYNLLGALVDLGTKDWQRVIKLFDEMQAADSEHKLIETAAQKGGLYLSEVTKDMPTQTSAQVAAKREIDKVQARLWSIWLFKKDPREAKNWYYVLKQFDDLEDWVKSKEIADAAMKRCGGKKNDKYVRYFEKSLARSTLEMAKLAYAGENKEEGDRLFAQARPVYAELVGEKNNATNEILEQAAQVFGGFLVGPDARGRYSFIQGNAEFDRASTIWQTLERRFAAERDKAKTEAERDVAERSYQRAKFYKFLTYYQSIKDNEAAKRKLRDSIDALFLKEKGQPGGPEFTNMWRWLKDQR
ncbi:MAG: hypothetical protein H6807_05720 [Planctomycetes bacterium]|nr:hypothetical protein [Planctomycetota bacterium]